MDCSLPGSSVHGILQARILEWVAVPFSSKSSQPKNQTQVSSIAGRFSTSWATREVPFWCLHSDGSLKLYHYNFSPETHNGLNFSMFSSTLVIFWIFHSGHPKGHKIVFHCGFFFNKNYLILSNSFNVKFSNFLISISQLSGFTKIYTSALSTVDLQYCVNVRCIVKWLSYIYTCFQLLSNIGCYKTLWFCFVHL